MSLIINKVYSQNLPTDRLIIKKIYGKVDKSDNSFTRPFKEGEGNFFIYDSVTYEIAYKTIVNLKNKDILLVITKAITTGLHGHRWGYEDFYFFEQKNGDFKLIDSIVSESDNPIGDLNDYSIIEIGKNKKALITTFQSTGNGHLESGKGFYLLNIGELIQVFGLNMEYDNSAWKIPENENDDCEAKRYTNDFEILKSDKDWYDIKVHHIDYGFKKGCKDEYKSIEKDILYIYKDGKYNEKK